MGFLGVYTAIYDYTPQGDGEMGMAEGDVLYVLEKGSSDGWWKAKKKASAEDEEEPVGLIPNNYIEEAPVLRNARAIYEYTRQTDEELSFSEEDILQVFDESDPDWILVGLDGDYGFVPSNYINIQETTNSQDSESSINPPALPTRPQSIASKSASPEPYSSPAAAIAGVLQGRARPPSPLSSPRSHSTNQSLQSTERRKSDDRSRNHDSQTSEQQSSPHGTSTGDEFSVSHGKREMPRIEEAFRTPGGFHMYNINEMVSIMGKRKKMPTTLGINLATGTILIVPERTEDEQPQEWSADKMTHYSREGKHVFMELVRPSKSIDFHAGAKDTAEEIVAALGELAGAARAEGLREVILAGSPNKQHMGQVLYDFVAQGDDEVTVAVGDDVLIVDSSQSDEWWKVRRLKNGKEGVVPSSYIEITENEISTSSSSVADRTRATVEQNRLEEIRLTKEAIKASKEPEQVRTGGTLPDRNSSLSAGDHGVNVREQRGKRENGRPEPGIHSKSKSRPDSSKVRTWTDRSGSFSVEAQLLGLRDGKLHLHKMNGVKIAVPIAKMSRVDLEYVEDTMGISLDDDKPLADKKRTKAPDKQRPAVELGVSVNKNNKPEYDWFQFFLSCDVPVGLCERYAQAFAKDSMDESVLPDVNATILRTLGLREGDIIKVMRALDSKYGRERSVQEKDAQLGGLFSGPGGALRNNTRKGRPAPTVQTSDVVDAAVFSTGDVGPSGLSEMRKTSTSKDGPAAQVQRDGFDDNAWDVKPAGKTATSQQSGLPGISPSDPPADSTSAALPQSKPLMTGSVKDLSLLTEPLQPTKTEIPATALPSSYPASQEASRSKSPQSATPSHFAATSDQGHAPLPNSLPTSSHQSQARQRPLPSSASPTQSSLLPPPPPTPQRPLSAPLSAQASFLMPSGQLPTQITGSVQGQLAPSGQSLNDIAQNKLQQQYAAQFQPLQPAMTGYIGIQGQNMTPFPAPVPGQQQYIYPVMPGLQSVGPFSDANRASFIPAIQAQQTGHHSAFVAVAPTVPHAFNGGGNLNNFLPPALEPQRTGALGLQPQQTGLNNIRTLPLQPHKTGPPPPVRFGTLSESTKLIPQQTGRRANLSQATPDNPFGF